MRPSVVGTLTLLLLASVPALAQVPADETAYERQAHHAFRLQTAERAESERHEALEAIARQASAAGAVMRQLDAELAAMRELALDHAALRRRAAPFVEDEARADHLGNRTHRIALASFGE